MGDWTSDAPGVRRKITVQDLPPPSSNILAINRARVVDRPANAQPRVPPGFKIELYAERFPRSAFSAHRAQWRHLRRRKPGKPYQDAARFQRQR